MASIKPKGPPPAMSTSTTSGSVATAAACVESSKDLFICLNTRDFMQPNLLATSPDKGLLIAIHHKDNSPAA
jgi:hypothetical protein